MISCADPAGTALNKQTVSPNSCSCRITVYIVNTVLPLQPNIASADRFNIHHIVNILVIFRPSGQIYVAIGINIQPAVRSRHLYTERCFFINISFPAGCIPGHAACISTCQCFQVIRPVSEPCQINRLYRITVASYIPLNRKRNVIAFQVRVLNDIIHRTAARINDGIGNRIKQLLLIPTGTGLLQIGNMFLCSFTFQIFLCTSVAPVSFNKFLIILIVLLVSLLFCFFLLIFIIILHLQI